LRILPLPQLFGCKRGVLRRGKASRLAKAPESISDFNSSNSNSRTETDLTDQPRSFAPRSASSDSEHARLTQDESASIPVKYHQLSSDQSNLQDRSHTIQRLSGNPVDKRMVLQMGIPNRRETLAFAHHVCALVRKIVRSLILHSKS
jgi:hypothetical protein